MPLQTFTPPIAPSPGTKVNTTPKLNTIEFGDGYTQITAAGLNHLKHRVDLKWEFLTHEQADQIVSFFSQHGGYRPFYYKPHNHPVVAKWVCKSWADEVRDDGFRSITCAFDISFTLEV